MSIALSLFVLRVAIGLVVAAHGSQELLGWFGLALAALVVIVGIVTSRQSSSKQATA